MSAMLRGVAIVTMVGLAGCSARSTQEPFAVQPGVGLTTDASRRVVITTPVGPGSVHGRVNPLSLVCAESSPDVMTALVNTFSLALQADAAKAPLAAGAGVGTSSSSAQQFAQLAEKTVAIQALDKTLWRACEAYNNGAISEIVYSLLFARIPETVSTLRYGELAGGDFGRSLAAVTTSGETRSSGSGSAEAKRLEEFALQTSSKSEDSAKDVREAERDFEKSTNEKLDLEKKVTSKNQEIDKTRGDLTTASPQALPAVERELSELRKEERTLSEKLREKTNEVAERQKKVEETKSEQRKRQDEAKTMQQVATEAKTAGTATAAGGISNAQAREVAGTLREMHRDFLRDDMSGDALLTACAMGLSSPQLYPGLEKQCSKDGTLHELTRYVLETRASYHALVSRNFNAEELARIGARVDIARATAVTQQAKADTCRAMIDKAKTEDQIKTAGEFCRKYLLAE